VPVGAGSDVSQEPVPLLTLSARDGGRFRGPVGLIDDDQLRAALQELSAVLVGLDEVDAGDEEGIMLVDAFLGRQASFELPDGAGPDGDRVQVKLLAELLLPLVAEIGRAEDAQAADDAPLQQLAGDDESLDGLADADIVGDEQADRALAQGHEQRHELVGTGAHGDASQRPQGRGRFPEGEAGRLPEKAGACGVPDIAGFRERKLGRLHALSREPGAGQVGQLPADQDDILVGAGQGPQTVDFIVAGRHQDPVPFTATHDRTDFGHRSSSPRFTLRLTSGRRSR